MGFSCSLSSLPVWNTLVAYWVSSFLTSSKELAITLEFMDDTTRVNVTESCRFSVRGARTAKLSSLPITKTQVAYIIQNTLMCFLVLALRNDSFELLRTCHFRWSGHEDTAKLLSNSSAAVVIYCAIRTRVVARLTWSNMVTYTATYRRYSMMTNQNNASSELQNLVYFLDLNSLFTYPHW